MAELTLLIGDRASSAVSFQAWLAMRQVGLMFRVQSSSADGSAPGLGCLAGEPPILLVDEVPIWEPLAIGEFLAEHVPHLWPSEPRARALARSVAYEAQRGLRSVQTLLPFDVTRRFSSGRLVRPLRRDLERVVTLWRDCRARFRAGGPFLFGPFSLADAMHAAIAMRLAGNSIEVGGEAGAYVETICTLPAVVEWVGEAHEEERSRSLNAREPVAPDVSSIPRTASESGDAVSLSPGENAQRIDGSSGERAVKPIGAGTRRRH